MLPPKPTQGKRSTHPHTLPTFITTSATDTNNTRSRKSQTKMDDAQMETPNLEMKNLHVARYKKGYPKCLLLHAEGVDKEQGARYDRFEMSGNTIRSYVRITADEALFLETLGSMPEDVSKLAKDCQAVYAGVEGGGSDKWIDGMVRFLQDSNDRVYRNIVRQAKSD
jgi:hypothetical protein